MVWTALNTIELQWLTWLQTVQPDWLLTVATGVTALGSFWFLAAVAVLGFLRERDTFWRQNVVLVPAVGLVVVLLKLIFHRPAPPTRELSLLPYTFPSGHTTLAFVMAGRLMERYDRRFLWYGLAAVVGLTRIMLGEHYLTDVVGGVVLGFGLTVAVRRYGDRVWLRTEEQRD